MKVEVSVFAICIIVFVVNAVLEHLFNWCVRLLQDKPSEFLYVLLFAFYAIKTVAIILGLKYITK